MKAGLLLFPLLAHAGVVIASQIPLRASLYSEPAAGVTPSSLDDPVQSSTSGNAGPLRIELPFQPEQYAHLAGASTTSKTQDAVLTVKEIIRAQAGEYVTLTHADMPEVSIRIRRLAEGRKPDELHAGKLDSAAFCDPSVTSWTGYADFLEGHSLFFYFFESRSDPDNDPLISFMNGGPGCASELALFMELGPCRIKENYPGPAPTGPPINATTVNPYAWNNRANLLFLDQPASVGFSYRRGGSEPVYDSDAAAVDFYKFLRLFYSAFENLRERPYIMASESYGGRYVPRFASEVLDQNRKVRKESKGKAASKELIPLAKVAIGNGLTDVVAQTPQYYDYLCTNKAGVASEPVLSIAECKRMAKWKKKCSAWLEKACRIENNFDDCGVAADTCEGELMGPWKGNPYNVLDDCKAGLSENLCYNAIADIRIYANREDVRALLGVEPTLGAYKGCSDDVARGFQTNLDSTVENGVYVEQLLEHGIEVLNYSGKLDVICNFLGSFEWIKKLEWSQSESYKQQRPRQWYVDGKKAGETQSGGNFTWATVDMAGHMVPYDKPREALAMINRFISGEAL